MSDSEKGTPVHQLENAMGTQPEASKSVDVVHHDEALRVLENYTGDETWTPEEEKKLRRKIDWRLMPVLCATYGLQYYDKAMLSQAVCTQSTPSSWPVANSTSQRQSSAFDRTWTSLWAIDTPGRLPSSTLASSLELTPLWSLPNATRLSVLLPALSSSGVFA